MDFKFFFFPWCNCPEYQIPDAVVIPQELEEYFEELQSKGIGPHPHQKFWYVKKRETQAIDMMREYPSTPDEAFHTSLEGAYYSKQMLEVRREKRIGHVSHDSYLQVNTSWDLGYGDSTAIWFFQLCGKEVHVIDFYENSGEPLTFYLKLLQDKPYQYHLVPHDAGAHEYSTGHSRVEIARKLGFTFSVVPNITIDEGIDAVRHLLPKCWFDEQKCASGIKALESYRRQWNETHGCWSSKPHHDKFSHAADAFRMLAVGFNRAKMNQSYDDRTLGGSRLQEMRMGRIAPIVNLDTINQSNAFRTPYTRTF